MARVMLLFGSGGHSAEMLMLAQNANLAELLHSKQIDRIICAISEDDTIVESKLQQQFSTHSKLTTVKFKRARKVGQSFVTSIWTTIISFIHAIEIVFNHEPQICLTNGPAISVTILLAIRLLQALTFCLRYRCYIIYIESFCRTRTLSLSGLIIYHLRLATTFLVQWPKLRDKYPRAAFRGLLV